jgi:hypothetical protein
MYRRFLCVLCVCLAFFSACFLKKNTPDSGSTKLSGLGVAVKIPESFRPLPQSQLKDVQALGATTLDVEPFTVVPMYAYADQDGKGVIVISHLQFSEGAVPRRYPMDNIFIYQKNLEAYFGAGEISNEEINGQHITTILLAMIFQEGDDGISLFKGLCYYYPEKFFMIDLYVVNSNVTFDDAAGFQNIFYSLSVY